MTDPKIDLAAFKAAAERAHRTFVPLEIRRNEDNTVDEVVVCGNVHVEQMDTGSWWIGIDTADGRLLHLNFHARGKITLNVQDEGPSEHAAHLGQCDPATILALVAAVEALDGLRDHLCLKSLACRLCDRAVEALARFQP